MLAACASLRSCVQAAGDTVTLQRRTLEKMLDQKLRRLLMHSCSSSFDWATTEDRCIFGDGESGVDRDVSGGL